MSEAIHECPLCWIEAHSGNPSVKCHKFDPKKYRFKIKKPLPPIQVCDVPHLEGMPAQVIIATDRRTKKVVEARIEIPPIEMYASKEERTRVILHEIGHVIAKGLSARERREYADISQEDDFEEKYFVRWFPVVAMGGTFIGFEREERRMKEIIDWMRANIVQSDLPVTLGFYGNGMKVTRKIEY